MERKKIGVIQTEYDGYKFRSRLEARWAVFFNVLGINWIYEPEGFVLEDGSMYLPDFYLPDLNIWVEVKGVLSTKDTSRIFNFNWSEGVSKIVVVGNIPEETDDVVNWIYNKYKSNEAFFDGMMDFPYLPCVCPTCGKFGFEFDGRGSRICRHDDDDKGYTADHPRIKAAYKIARQARFEHGETPLIGKVVEVKTVADKIRSLNDTDLIAYLYTFGASTIIKCNEPGIKYIDINKLEEYLKSDKENLYTDDSYICNDKVSK